MDILRNLNKYLFNPDSALESNLKVLERLNDHSRYAEPLFNATAEFCAEFNLRVDGAANGRSGQMYLVTPNGFYAGEILIESDRNSEIVYTYSNRFTVQKSRGGAGRSSKKLPSLIRAVKKNDEIGTDISCINRYTAQVNNGLNNIKQNTRGVNMTNYAFGDVFALDVVMAAAGLKEVTHETKQKAINLYTQYKQDMELNKNAVDIKSRFKDGGFYVVGLAGEEHDFKRSELRAYIGEGVYVDGHLKLSDMKAKNSLGDNFFITTAMAHAKTKYESQTVGYVKNMYKIPFIDKYDDELDMVIAYQDHTIVWVLIPKVAP
jgi:hypothetical protein